MVGLFDIACVGKLDTNVLESKMTELKIQELIVSTKTQSAKDDGEIIYDHVLKWQTDVEKIKRSAKEFEERYKNRSSWRSIQHMANQVTALVDSVKGYLVNEIAYLPPFKNLPKSNTAFQDFQSRKEAYEKLWEALVAEDSTMILGIYGMPGVGKTRMMEQIWQDALDKKIFDKVTHAHVGSDKLNLIELQNQIAGHLNCHLESQDNEKRRACQLKNSLMNGGKILVILDDVWSEIPFHRIGIALGDGSSSRGCKILITSRKKDVCLVNGCMHPVKITLLTKEESWDLFKNTVGPDTIDRIQDESLVQKVCAKCAGLPLLIRAVGKALQFRRYSFSWMNALDQLEKGKVENIARLDPQVYASVKLSIDRLPDDAKSCLFLSSLFPEDAHIYITKLIQLATGSCLVPDKGAKIRMWDMVDYLRSSSLLLDSQEDHVIKLHALIRDVAKSIAVRDPKYAFLHARCGTQLVDNDAYATRKLLRLDLECNDVHVTNDRVFPNLHSLWLQCNKHMQKFSGEFSGGFFGMFVNLRFLLIEGMFCSLELQLSLEHLGELRTLILDNCDLTHIDQTKVHLFPKYLETLCIWDCNLPVPLYLPNLKYLRKLEIQGWKNGVQMVPNTISNMPCLEELHIPEGIEWKGIQM